VTAGASHFLKARAYDIFVDYQAAVSSPVADLIKRCPIKSQHVIAHIRKATQGRVSLANCHPFVRELWGRYWVFAHNGDLKNFMPQLDGPYRPVGTTDSELAFCYLLQQLRRRFGDQLPALAELTPVLRELTAEIAGYGPFNMMLSDWLGPVCPLLHQFVLHRAATSVCHRQIVG